MQPLIQRLTPKVLKTEKGASEEKGESARISNFIGSMALADLVKTTLGPKGMDKIMQSLDENGAPKKEIVITNDGATILKLVSIDNPAAKLLVEISKTQDDDIGDGTTSVVVLAGEFLREADKLVSKNIHPQTIIRGMRKSVKAAREALLKSSMDCSDEQIFYDNLFNIAKTTLSSKILNAESDHFAKLCVDAVLKMKGSTNLESIQIIKKVGGNLKDSFLSEGFILDKSIGVGQPKCLKNPSILIANTSMDTDKIKIFGAKVKVKSMSKIAEIEKAEKNKMKQKVDKILKHKINCFINRQLIYNYPEQLFADNNVMAIEHADFEGIERLALALGGDICSTFDNPKKVKLGKCELIEECYIGEDKLIKFSGVSAGNACTIVLRGASSHLLDEAERSIHDVLCVISQTVNNKKTVYGGGCSEILMAKAVDDLAINIRGKEQKVVESFSKALSEIPGIIADNGGFDGPELIANLRAEHHNGNCTAGLDMKNGTVGDMSKLKIMESFRAKDSMIAYAHEAAEMILKVDDIVQCSPRPREQRNTGM